MIRRLLLCGGGTGGVAIPREFTVTAAPVGAWPWTQAFYSGGYSYIGTTDDAGKFWIVRVTHADGTVTTTQVGGPTAVDQHDMAVPLRRSSDGKLVAVYTGHASPNIYRRISTNADDSTAWGTEANIDSQIGSTLYTYPMTMQLNDETNDPIYLFFRDQDPTLNNWEISKSTDGGSTWGAFVNLTYGTRVYGRAFKTSDSRIDFAFTDGSFAEDYASVWHCYYTGGNLYKTDGTLIGAVGSGPYAQSAMTLVYNGASAGARYPATLVTQGSEIAVGIPVQTGTPTGHIGTDGDYIYCRWDGSAWSTHTLAASVGMTAFEFTEGGLAIDPSDINRVVMSIRGAGGVGNWHIWDARTADGGTTWAKTQITSSGADDRYPWFIDGHQPELQYVWLKGTFTTQSSYSSGIEGWGIAA